MIEVQTNEIGRQGESRTHMDPVNLSIAYQAKGIPAVENTCQNCGKLTFNPKYCSKSCSAKVNGRLFPKRKKSNICKTCSCLIASDRTYCSPACYPKSRKKLRRGYEHIKNYRKKTKQQAIDYKGGKCSICGYSKCPQALDFHHIEPHTKEFNFSGKSLSFESIKPELDKCVLLCANCHREVHAGLHSIIKSS